MIHHQRGFTLISLMVGTVISMVGILALLFIYKDLVHTSVTALSGAKLDGQIASAQLTMQKELQTAGFGIDQAKAGTHLILLRTASLNAGNVLLGSPQSFPPIDQAQPNGDHEGNALIWSYRETIGGSVKCAGLLIEKDTSTERIQLSRLQSLGGCTQALSQSGITWEKTILIADGQLVPGDGEAGTWPFAGRLTECWPFRKNFSTTRYYPQITIRTRVSSIDSSGKPLVTSSTVCMPNFPESTPPG